MGISLHDVASDMHKNIAIGHGGTHSLVGHELDMRLTKII